MFSFLVQTPIGVSLSRRETVLRFAKGMELPEGSNKHWKAIQLKITSFAQKQH